MTKERIGELRGAWSDDDAPGASQGPSLANWHVPGEAMRCPGCRLLIKPDAPVVGAGNDDPFRMLWHQYCMDYFQMFGVRPADIEPTPIRHLIPMDAPAADHQCARTPCEPGRPCAFAPDPLLTRRF